MTFRSKADVSGQHWDGIVIYRWFTLLSLPRLISGARRRRGRAPARRRSGRDDGRLKRATRRSSSGTSRAAWAPPGGERGADAPGCEKEGRRRRGVLVFRPARRTPLIEPNSFRACSDWLTGARPQHVVPGHVAAWLETVEGLIRSSSRPISSSSVPSTHALKPGKVGTSSGKLRIANCGLNCGAELLLVDAIAEIE